MTSDPMARFAVSGETLDPELRREVLALGPAAIPGLLRILNDDALQMEDSPGDGWPPIHAVDLLADLKATDAVEPMPWVLCETDWDHIIGPAPRMSSACAGRACSSVAPWPLPRPPASRLTRRRH